MFPNARCLVPPPPKKKPKQQDGGGAFMFLGIEFPAQKVDLPKVSGKGLEFQKEIYKNREQS